MIKVIVVGTYSCTISVLGESFTSYSSRGIVMSIPDSIANADERKYDQYVIAHFESAIKSMIAEIIPYDNLEVSISSIHDYRYIEVGHE